MTDRELETTVSLSTLRWWRDLLDLNPADLAPRLDARIAALVAEIEKDKK